MTLGLIFILSHRSSYWRLARYTHRATNHCLTFFCSKGNKHVAMKGMTFNGGDPISIICPLWYESNDVMAFSFCDFWDIFRGSGSSLKHQFFYYILYCFDLFAW